MDENDDGTHPRSSPTCDATATHKNLESFHGANHALGGSGVPAPTRSISVGTRLERPSPRLARAFACDPFYQWFLRSEDWAYARWFEVAAGQGR
jgi:hypothetical protein